MSDDGGLVYGYILDGRGGGRSVGWPDIDRWQADQGALWVHLDFNEAHALEWLREKSGIDPIVCEALLADETRPRSQPFGEGLLVILRGVNLNPNADPEDMVAVRVWAERNRIITIRRRRLLALQDIHGAVDAGRGPKSTGAMLVDLTDRMVVRMGPIIDDIEDEVDSLEDRLLVEQSAVIRYELAELRRQAIRLRRYLAPQREAMARLLMDRPDWFSASDHGRLREVADRVIRYIEDLDASRDKAVVTQEELSARISEQMNQRMYILTVVASIVLPLSFITGLLGINVDGMPGAKWPWAFWTVCGLLVVIGVVQAWLFKKLKLM